ncbi:MAG TPA: VOC family protein [Solirubrobacteraceae bacterium]|nr:VOC family protein [Solirubrobacteraceae bacterium]
MSERTSYAPGTFSWTDLSTTDQEGAKQFYGELFGWDADDQPVGDGMTYSMMNIGGKPVAGISAQNEMQRQAGAPPAWNSYVTVESADASADRASKLGATVIAPPFDVMDVGRMAVIQDQQGAFFMVWEPKLHIGASIVNAPGALSWNELATVDLDSSAAFYSELFGWQADLIEDMPFPYRVIQNNGAGNGGMRPAGDNEPTYWLVYFGTDDIDASLAKVAELGGTKLMGPMDIGMGKIGVAVDPQGAAFALFAGDFDG